jgi:hypothetical protein
VDLSGLPRRRVSAPDLAVPRAELRLGPPAVHDDAARPADCYPESSRTTRVLAVVPGPWQPPNRRYPLGRIDMLGYIAAALFLIAFLINATSTSTPAVFAPLSLLLLGLASLALHLAGVGTGWSFGGRGRRR